MRILFDQDALTKVAICRDTVKSLEAQVSKPYRETTALVSAFDESTACFSSAANFRFPPFLPNAAPAISVNSNLQRRSGRSAN